METIASKASRDAPRPGRLAVIGLAIAEALKLWWRRRKTRVHLALLTDEQLRDVGLSREIAEREIRKSRLLLVERPHQPPF